MTIYGVRVNGVVKANHIRTTFFYFKSHKIRCGSSRSLLHSPSFQPIFNEIINFVLQMQEALRRRFFFLLLPYSMFFLFNIFTSFCVRPFNSFTFHLLSITLILFFFFFLGVCFSPGFVCFVALCGTANSEQAAPVSRLFPMACVAAGRASFFILFYFFLFFFNGRPFTMERDADNPM